MVAAYAGRRAWLAFHPDAYTEFWNEVLTPSRSNVVVLADSGLGYCRISPGHGSDCMSMPSATHPLLSTAFAQRFPDAPFGIDRFKNLTSTADTHSLLDLVALPQFAATSPRVRSAQEVHMDDLSANAIIVGGPEQTPGVNFMSQPRIRLEIPGSFTDPNWTPVLSSTRLPRLAKPAATPMDSMRKKAT